MLVVNRVVIRIDDIEYIEVCCRKTHINLKGKSISCNLTLKQLCGDCGDLVYIRRDILVNPFKVRYADNNHVVMCSGIVLPVSKRMRNNLVDYFRDAGTEEVI